MAAHVVPQQHMDCMACVASILTTDWTQPQLQDCASMRTMAGLGPALLRLDCCHLSLLLAVLLLLLLAAAAACTQLELLKMDPTFLNRNVNQGFSGGEKKRNEILQLAVLEVSAPAWHCKVAKEPARIVVHQAAAAGSLQLSGL